MMFKEIFNIKYFTHILKSYTYMRKQLQLIDNSTVEVPMSKYSVI